LTEENLKTF
jgi:hypothetical protein